MILPVNVRVQFLENFSKDNSAITIFFVSGLGSFKLLKSLQPVHIYSTVLLYSTLAVPSQFPLP